MTFKFQASIIGEEDESVEDKAWGFSTQESGLVCL
jgi:hypothetical protein